MIKHWLRIGCPAVIAAAATFMAPAAHADIADDLAQARTNLLGNGTRSWRVWVKERIIVSMGADKGCTSGETYSFRSNGSVDIAVCTNHVLTRHTVPWTLAAAPPLDVNLLFDGRSYQLSFAGTPHESRMRWRRLGQVKPDPTTDIYLGLSKD